MFYIAPYIAPGDHIRFAVVEAGCVSEIGSGMSKEGAQRIANALNSEARLAALEQVARAATDLRAVITLTYDSRGAGAAFTADDWVTHSLVEALDAALGELDQLGSADTTT